MKTLLLFRLFFFQGISNSGLLLQSACNYDEWGQLNRPADDENYGWDWAPGISSLHSGDPQHRLGWGWGVGQPGCWSTYGPHTGWARPRADLHMTLSQYQARRDLHEAVQGWVLAASFAPFLLYWVHRHGCTAYWQAKSTSSESVTVVWVHLRSNIFIALSNKVDRKLSW